MRAVHQTHAHKHFPKDLPPRARLLWSSLASLTQAEGDMRPGMVVSDECLCERCGFGPHTLRKARKDLTESGLISVEVYPNGKRYTLAHFWKGGRTLSTDMAHICESHPIYITDSSTDAETEPIPLGRWLKQQGHQSARDYIEARRNA